MSKALVIIRLQTGSRVPLLNAKRREAVRVALMNARVRRPGLEEWLMGNNMASLPALTVAEFDAMCAMPEPKRSELLIEHGFIIPNDSLGRIGKVTESARESIRLWIFQRFTVDDVPMFDRGQFGLAIVNVR